MRLDPIKPVFEEPGPFLTLYVDVGRASEDAPQQLQARWTTIRHRMEHLGAAESLVARAEVTHALEAHDPEATAPLIQIESGGRAAGASDEALWDEVRAELTRMDREEDAGIAARLDEARGRGEGAAAGVDDVASSLVEGRVDQLVLDLAALGGRTIDPSRLEGIPLPRSAAEADELPADLALVAAGALSGADLTLLPATMSRGGGAAALLRWS